MDRETRRRFLTGTVTAFGGAIAGCTSSEGTDNQTDTETATSTTAGDGAQTTATATDTETATATDTVETPYTASIEPMGTVEFEAVPETWLAYFSTYGDMGIALGQRDGLEALVFTENWPLQFFEQLPGVEASFDDVQQLYSEESIDKEVFYELDCDLHLFDPNFIQLLDDNWSDEDFTEVANEIGPVFGNSIRRRGEDWHDYQYYSLYEAFERVATVFQQQERYRAIKAVHDGLIEDVQSQLPAEDERPSIGLLSVNSDFENGSFYAYPVHDGNGHKQYRDLGINGAFGPHIDGSYAEWDYETLLEVDPEVLVFAYGFSHVSTEEFEARMETMRDDPIGSQLTAVDEDRLYRGGTSYQGPIINLFQTEIAAKQFYPDTFGAFEGVGSTPAAEQLFDRQRVADVINGEF